MKIVEFIEAMMNEEAPVAELITTKKYVASAEKVRVANETIDFSVEYDRGFVKFDTYKKYLAFIFGVIESHTNLRFTDDWTGKVQEYDLLCERELLDAIIDTFRRDYDASLTVLDMMCADMLANNSMEASMARLVTSAAENLDIFVDTISDKIEDLNIEKIIPNNLDLDKLAGLLNKFT